MGREGTHQKNEKKQGHYPKLRLLSSYPSDVLNDYIKQNGWYSKGIAGSIQIGARTSKRKPKVEVLTANYEIG